VPQSLLGAIAQTLYLAIVLKIAKLVQGFDATLADRPFLVLTFGHSGAQVLAPECPKVKNKKWSVSQRGVTVPIL